MANYLSIKYNISDIPLAALRVGSRTLVSFPVPPSPDPEYAFTFYKGIGLAITDILDLATLKVAITSGQQNSYNSLRLEMSDVLSESDLKVAIMQGNISVGRIGTRIYFRNFTLG